MRRSSKPWQASHAASTSAPDETGQHCTKCRGFKSRESFSPSTRHRSGLFPWCLVCKADYQRAYTSSQNRELRYQKNAEQRVRRDARAEVRAKYLTASAAYSLRARYSLTPSEVLRLASVQNGVCGICGSPPRDPSQRRGGLHIDHDHETGVVRGLLCEPCNQGLGFFKDSTARLEAAVAYLQLPPFQRLPVPPAPDRAALVGPSKHEEMLRLICKGCGKEFRRKARDEYKTRRRKEGPFCSPVCSGSSAHSTRVVRGLVHGTTTGYTSHKCRCTQCRRAHAEAEFRRKKSGHG